MHGRLGNFGAISIQGLRSGLSSGTSLVKRLQECGDVAIPVGAWEVTEAAS